MKIERNEKNVVSTIVKRSIRWPNIKPASPERRLLLGCAGANIGVATRGGVGEWGGGKRWTNHAQRLLKCQITL